jgi:hypothetical protein
LIPSNQIFFIVLVFLIRIILSSLSVAQIDNVTIGNEEKPFVLSPADGYTHDTRPVTGMSAVQISVGSCFEQHVSIMFLGGL